MSFDIHRLVADDVALMQALSATFGEGFDEVDVYTGNRPGASHLRELLAGDTFIAPAALKCNDVVGGLAACELRTFEQERSEIFCIYDPALAAAHRCQADRQSGCAAAKGPPDPARIRRAGR